MHGKGQRNWCHYYLFFTCSRHLEKALSIRMSLLYSGSSGNIRKRPPEDVKAPLHFPPRATLTYLVKSQVQKQQYNLRMSQVGLPWYCTCNSHMFKTVHKPLDWWLHTRSKLSKSHWIQSSSMDVYKTQDYKLPWLQQAKPNMDNNISRLQAFVDVLHLILLCSLLSSLVYNQAAFTWCSKCTFSTWR